MDKSEDLFKLVQQTPFDFKEQITSDMNHSDHPDEWSSIELHGAGLFKGPIDDTNTETRLKEMDRVLPHVKVLHTDVRRWQLSLLNDKFDTVPSNLLKDRIGNFPRLESLAHVSASAWASASLVLSMAASIALPGMHLSSPNLTRPYGGCPA